MLVFARIRNWLANKKVPLHQHSWRVWNKEEHPGMFVEVRSCPCGVLQQNYGKHGWARYTGLNGYWTLDGKLRG